MRRKHQCLLRANSGHLNLFGHLVRAGDARLPPVEGTERKQKIKRERNGFYHRSCTLYVSERYGDCQLDTIARISDLAKSDRRDQFIPVRKEDLFSALIKQRDLADPAERELFWRFARTLRTICHYEYSEMLDRLRDDYYYFSPEVAVHATADRAKSDSAYDDLIRSLDKVLKDANFEEMPHEEVTDAHRKRTLRVEVKAEHDDFREVRFYKRGRHVEQLEINEWFGIATGAKSRLRCSMTSCLWWR